MYAIKHIVHAVFNHILTSDTLSYRFFSSNSYVGLPTGAWGQDRTTSPSTPKILDPLDVTKFISKNTWIGVFFRFLAYTCSSKKLLIILMAIQKTKSLLNVILPGICHHPLNSGLSKGNRFLENSLLFAFRQNTLF